MNINLEETELFQLFGGFFHQDYDLMVDINEEESLVKQFIQAYVKGSNKDSIESAINELKQIVYKQFSEDLLETEVYERLGIEIDPEFHGYTYQGFLEAVLSYLISLSETKLVNSGYYHNK